MRKVTLSKGSALWEIGDTANNIAILEKGTLGIRLAEGLVGVATPRSVLGESAILAIGGDAAEKRSAAVVALEDETAVTEYPAAMVKQAIDAGKDQVGPLVLTTLVGQACRNLLIVISAHRKRPIVESPLKSLMQALIERGREIKPILEWGEFMTTFRFLYELRDYSESLREKMAEKASRAEASVKASEVVKDLFKGADFQEYLEELLREEREKDQWLQRGGAGAAPY
jgi:CRP-like cAMP-binding protein